MRKLEEKLLLVMSREERGVKMVDLQKILAFIYNGEVTIAQEDFKDFMGLAKDLGINGLTQVLRRLYPSLQRS